MRKPTQSKLSNGKLGYVKLKNGEVYQKDSQSTCEIGGYRIILRDGLNTKFVFYSEVEKSYYE